MPWVDIDYARSVVNQMYPGDKWHSRVRIMSDAQVLAIYNTHIEKIEQQKQIPKAANSVKEEPIENATEPKRVFTPDRGEQLSLTDILNQAEL